MPWLPWIAFGLVAGCCLPAAPTGAWWHLLAAGAVTALCARRWPLAARWSAALAAGLLGALLAPPAAQPPSDGGRVLAVRGTVASLHWQGHTQGFGLVGGEALLPAGWQPPARLFVRAPGLPGVRPGDLVTARGAWSVDVRGERLDAVDLAVEPREEGARGFAWRALERVGPRRELACTLLLGRGDAPERVEFRTAGLAHVLAVSGMHLAIAAGLAWWLLRISGVAWGPRLAAVGTLVIGYTWLTAASPATVRACAMVLALAIYNALRREPHRLGPVALAALLLVAWDPGMARDIGFQLSLAAVLGIVTIGRDLLRLRELALDLRPWPLDRPLWRGLLWCGRATADGLIIGLAATLATAPVLAWHFGQAAPAGWLISLPAGVPATLALWSGLPLIGCAGAWPDGPWEGLYRILELNLDALAAVAAWGAAHLPQVAVPAPPPGVLLAWPILFLPLRDRRDLLLRIVGVSGLLAVWALA